jgi:hypothetical protein
MGLAVAVFLTADAVVLWLLGDAVRKNTTGLRGVLIVFLLGYLALALVSMRYFFLPPVIVELLIVLCILMAVLALGHPDAPAN